jgi:hypothetical protein
MTYQGASACVEAKFLEYLEKQSRAVEREQRTNQKEIAWQGKAHMGEELGGQLFEWKWSR